MTASQPESAATFLRRMRAAGRRDDAAIAELEAAIEDHRGPRHAIDL